MSADRYRSDTGAVAGLDDALARRAQQLQRMARDAARGGRQDDALAALSEAVAIAPTDAAICCDLGRLLARRGELEASLPWFERAAAQQPTSLEARFFLGLTLLRVGRSTDAVPHLRHAALAAPDDPAVRAALADAEFHAGNDAEALVAITSALASKPGDEDLLLKRGEVLARSGGHEAALAHFEGAAVEWPQHPGLWMALGQAREEAGDANGAESAYRRALDQRPRWPQPLAALLGLRRGASAGHDVAMAEALLAGGGLDASDTALVAYPLGRVHDARGEHDLAFATWRLANEAREREVGPLDLAGFDADLQRQLDVSMAHPAPPPGESPLVFVVGMPRSGTTLVEQVLAAHHDAAGCGELPFFAELVARWRDPTAMPQVEVDRLAADYLAIARRHGSPQVLRLVDKAPLNALHLGHVARLFPAARVIWCRRDARDVALSIFSENFAKSARFATSLESIAACINAQHRLMRHWQRASGLRIHELAYESLVADFEPQARTIVDFCGLPWSDACLDFHQRERVVQTPSRWQVRQPVHQGSIGRWRRYADALAPLVAKLDVPVEADGVPRS